jgi:hypothetical protein
MKFCCHITHFLCLTEKTETSFDLGLATYAYGFCWPFVTYIVHYKQTI